MERATFGPVEQHDEQSRRPVAVTGIKPTGTPHLGNYLGAIRPALRLAERYEAFYFIADYHALTTERDPEALRGYVRDVAATWLACGLDPARVVLFRQSDVPEVHELAWIFACLLGVGQLERGHAYKDALARGEKPGAGILYYPVLMAADIVLYGADVVPVGKDQKQHLELTRDVAARLDHLYGEGTVRVPEALVTDAPLVPGLDGEKMSKSKGNTIPLFAPSKQLRKSVMRIVTGPEPLEAPKDPEPSTVWQLYRLVAGQAAAERMAERLRAGGYGWGHAKQELFEALEAEIGPMRARYEALRADPEGLDRVLREGADRARSVARETIERVRRAIGIR